MHPMSSFNFSPTIRRKKTYKFYLYQHPTFCTLILRKTILFFFPPDWREHLPFMLSAPVVLLLPGWHLKIFPQVHFHIKDHRKHWQKGPKAQSVSFPESWLWFLPPIFVHFKVCWQSCNCLDLPKRLQTLAHLPKMSLKRGSSSMLYLSM